MKHIQLILIISLLPLMLLGQTGKGGWRLGTSASLSPLGLFGEALVGSDNHAGVAFDEDFNIFSISGGPGYFVADRALVGVNFSLLSIGGDDLSEDRVSIISFSPAFRYYIAASPKVMPYLEGRAGLTRISDGDDGESSGIFGAQGGAAFFLNNHISLDLFLDFSQFREKDDDVTITQSLTTLGLSFSLFF